MPADGFAAVADKPLDAINPFDPAIISDPHPYLARLREEAPVYRSPITKVVMVSTYDLIMEVCARPKVFSNKFGDALRAGSSMKMDPEEIAILRTGYPPIDTMLTADPPQHTRYRKLGAKAFTMKRVEAMGDYVNVQAHELIDAFIGAGRCEFKTAFADQLPMRVIADALGVPREDMGKFKMWSDGFVAQLGQVADRETRLWAARMIVEFQHYFAAKIEEKRANPTEDVISDLITATLADEGDPRGLDVPEILSICQQLLVAGNETTAHSITAGIYYLIKNPAERAKLEADPGLIPNFVEEVLRTLTPTNNMWRVVLEDAEIGGFPVAKGEILLLRFGSGNRDGAKFADPDAFKVDRPNAKEHLAFGAGIHHCIGAQLARKEMCTAFPILLSRLKNIRFADGVDTFSYAPNILLRGVERLDLEFDAA
jgi:cytochrome P450